MERRVTRSQAKGKVAEPHKLMRGKRTRKQMADKKPSSSLITPPDSPTPTPKPFHSEVMEIDSGLSALNLGSDSTKNRTQNSTQPPISPIDSKDSLSPTLAPQSSKHTSFTAITSSPHSKTIRHSATVGQSGELESLQKQPNQSQRKLDVKQSVGKATFEMATEDLAFALCKKTQIDGRRKLEGRELDTVSNYECVLADAKYAHAWNLIQKEIRNYSLSEAAPSSEVNEKPTYAPLAKFLNKIVTICRSHLPKGKGNKLYPKLMFHVWDRVVKPMADHQKSLSYPPHDLKPDLIGANSKSMPQQIYWQRQGGEGEAVIPVEVKKTFEEALVQLGTYAYCQRAAYPSRQYSLGLAYCYTTRLLKFAVYHAGGLTVSKSFSLYDPLHIQDIARLFLAILSWESYSDAGLPERDNEIEIFEDDNTVLKPGKYKLATAIHDACAIRGRSATVYNVNIKPESIFDSSELHPLQSSGHQRPSQPPETQPLNPSQPPETQPLKTANATYIVKRSWVGSDVEAKLLENVKGVYGLPNVVHSSVVRHGHIASVYLTNHLFLEKVEAISLFDPSGTPTDPRLYARTCWMHVMRNAGKPVHGSRDLNTLLVGVLDAMIGYLNLIEIGYHHRDVSHHNVLVDTERVHKVPVLQKNVGPQLTDEDKDALNKALKDSEFQITDFFFENYDLDAMNDMISEILASEHSPGTLIDGDIAIHMPTYFDNTNGLPKSEVSGTELFMSSRLLRILFHSIPCLHSPTDDFWSYFYLVHHAYTTLALLKAEDPDIRKRLRTHYEDLRTTWDKRDNNITNHIFLPAPNAKKLYGDLYARCLPLTCTWWHRLRAVELSWEAVEDKYLSGKICPSTIPKLFGNMTRVCIYDFLVIWKEELLRK